MAKTHTREKRKKGLSPHFRHHRTLDTVEKKNRLKTFSTEDAAKAWAEKNKIKASDYTIEKAKKDKKFKVVLKNKK